MSTIEDKILNGPRLHYCDEGDDDIRREEIDQEDDKASDRVETGDASSLFQRPSEDELPQTRWRGTSSNTGPKGVIEDFNRKELDDLDAEFQALMNDESILKEYITKRISDNIPTFGQVYHLRNGDELLEAIDKENPNVLVIAHIYTKYSRPCSNLNRCLNELANELKHIKFVTLDASVTGLSGNFKENGVPALLAYKAGDLVKSLVQLEEFLDKNFDASQVKELLIDNKLTG